MPLFRFLTLLILALCFFLVGMTSTGQETDPSFVIPENRAQVSFPAKTPQRQLMGIAQGFSGSAAAPESPVVPASTNAEDSSSIRLASVREDDVSEETPTETPEGEPTPADSLLSRSIGLKVEPSGKAKMERPKFSGAIAPLVSVFGSLLIVLSAFLLLAFLFKKVTPKGNRVLPKEAFEDLGRTFLTQKLQLHLLRLGNRLILVSVTPDGATPITEVTDPDEVVPLLGMCRKLDTNSSSELFRKTLSSFSGDDSQNDYFGTDSTVKKTAKTKSKSAVDLYSDPDESLADLLASGLKGKGGKNV